MSGSTYLASKKENKRNDFLQKSSVGVGWRRLGILDTNAVLWVILDMWISDTYSKALKRPLVYVKNMVIVKVAYQFRSSWLPETEVQLRALTQEEAVSHKQAI